MCGISGKLLLHESGVLDPAVIDRMNEAVRHRGPDDSGVYCDENIALAHRRLSIIGLDSGREPLSNEDDTVWLSFNGEIYNYRELRKELRDRGHRFKTETDSEVLVHLWEEHGEEFLSRVRGMFAFALYDKRTATLLLARDRVGIKPLYYATTGNSLLFASELKSILQDPSVEASVNRAAIDRFLSFYYLPGEESLLEGVRKLPPGHYLVSRNGRTEIKEYWDLDFPEHAGSIDFGKARGTLMELLREVVHDHLVSDVPVGVLLSGGVDSTAVLSLAAKQSPERISTFTIGFDDETVADERPFARLAAERFRTQHHETTISPEAFFDFLPKYVWHMEEPVCEPPAIALYYLSRMAARHVKVVLSGEGGDEAFAGYQTYRNLVWLERLRPLRLLLQGLGGPERIRRLTRLLSLPLHQYYLSRTSTPFHHFNRNESEFYTEEFRAGIDRDWAARPVEELFVRTSGRPLLSQMLYVDTKTWLPDDLLIKADKMTMANSLELRVPLLDHRVLEYSASLPPDFKLRGFSTKHILKRTFAELVPPEIIKRKKAGFPVPYEKWFRTVLKDSVRGLLMDGRSLGRGYFRKEAVERLLDGHEKHGLYSKEIFSLAVLEHWHRLFVDERPGRTLTESAVRAAH